MMRKLSALLGAALLLGALAEPAAAQRRDFDDRDRDRRGPAAAEWDELGCVEVDRRTVRDVIRVGRREGSYSAIRLLARGADAEIDDITVVYGNGQPDRLQVRARINAGSETRAIDLEGRERFISSIEITSQKASRGRGQLCAYGLKIVDRRDDRRPDMRAAPMERGWEELGCVEVSSRAGRDVIPVGRAEGGFVALRLAAQGGDVDVAGMRVIYGNGQPDQLNVNAVIRDGTATRPIDLLGGARRINAVVVETQKAYRERFGRGNWRPARLCVYGMIGSNRRPEPQMRRGDITPQWEELGCKNVSFVADSDTIPVGRREGRFKAIRLLALRNDVKVREIRVNYANGEPDVLAVGGTIRKGEASQPLDLRGRERAIGSVDLYMVTRIKGLGSLLKGEARVCVQGLQ